MKKEKNKKMRVLAINTRFHTVAESVAYGVAAVEWDSHVFYVAVLMKDGLYFINEGRLYEEEAAAREGAYYAARRFLGLHKDEPMQPYVPNRMDVWEKPSKFGL